MRANLKRPNNRVLNPSSTFCLFAFLEILFVAGARRGIMFVKLGQAHL